MTAEAVAETSGQSGGGISDHRAGKEIITDVPPGPQGGTAITEEEEEEYNNFFSEFFGPASVVGSSAFRSRDRVPHPKDIPNRGNVFDDERLKKVWWDRVKEIDELKNPTKVASWFARTSVNVSICRPIFIYVAFLASHYLSLCRELSSKLSQLWNTTDNL